jgi:hypothetical protein
MVKCGTFQNASKTVNPFATKLVCTRWAMDRMPHVGSDRHSDRTICDNDSLARTILGNDSRTFGNGVSNDWCKCPQRCFLVNATPISTARAILATSSTTGQIIWLIMSKTSLYTSAAHAVVVPNCAKEYHSRRCHCPDLR